MLLTYYNLNVQLHQLELCGCSEFGHFAEWHQRYQTTDRSYFCLLHILHVSNMYLVYCFFVLMLYITVPPEGGFAISSFSFLFNIAGIAFHGMGIALHGMSSSIDYQMMQAK